MDTVSIFTSTVLVDRRFLNVQNAVVLDANTALVVFINIDRADIGALEVHRTSLDVDTETVFVRGTPVAIMVNGSAEDRHIGRFIA